MSAKNQIWRIAKRISDCCKRLGFRKPEYLVRAEELKTWIRRRYASPSPNFVKRAVLLRNGLPDCVWVETGTFVGGTTRLLAKHSKYVVSIEPDRLLFNRAQRRLRKVRNLEIVNGPSEEVLPQILPDLRGNVCFWLDGHYSGGVTYRGHQDSPIVDELLEIEKHISKFDNISILVDDVRMFDSNHQESSYPPLEALVAWAMSNQFHWTIEHDIFVARRDKD